MIKINKKIPNIKDDINNNLFIDIHHIIISI